MKLNAEMVINYKKEIASNNYKIKNFPDENVSIIAEEVSSKYKLKLGDEYIQPSSFLNDQEILDWAINHEIFDEGKEINLEKARDSYDQRESENPPLYTYPSGRAYIFFYDLEFIWEFIDLLNMHLTESEMPGCDLNLVTIDDYESLVLLQWVLEKNGMKVNFEMKPNKFRM